MPEKIPLGPRDLSRPRSLEPEAVHALLMEEGGRLGQYIAIHMSHASLRAIEKRFRDEYLNLRSTKSITDEAELTHLEEAASAIKNAGKESAHMSAFLDALVAAIRRE